MRRDSYISYPNKNGNAAQLYTRWAAKHIIRKGSRLLTVFALRNEETKYINENKKDYDNFALYPLASSAAEYFSQEKADIPDRTARQSFLMLALFSSNLSSVRFQPRRRLTSSAAVFARMPIRWSLFRQLSISMRLQSRWR